MTIFKFTFLLACPIERLSEDKIPIKVNKNQKPNVNPSKVNKSDRKSTDTEGSGPEKPKHVIEVTNPLAYMHVEYELIPKKFSYQFDIICWDNVVKIFTPDGYESLKTVILEKKAWFYVTIEHHLTKLELEDLCNLQRHAFRIKIFDSKLKLGPKAKADNSKVFYIQKSDVGSTDFVSAYEIDPNIITDEEVTEADTQKAMGTHKMVKDILLTCTSGARKNEVVSLIHYGDYNHEYLVRDIIIRIMQKEEIPITNYIPPAIYVKSSMGKSELSPTDLINKKNQKKSKASVNDKPKDDKKTNDMNFLISGEIFFTDPEWSIYSMQNPSNVISDGYAIISCSKLLTQRQKSILNPIIIKIKKIENLPAETLKGFGFETIFASYTIPEIAIQNTLHQTVDNTVKFYESHVHFSHEAPKINLPQFIIANRLCVNINGIRTKETRTGLFGSEYEDKDLSKKLTFLKARLILDHELRHPELVTLATTCFDISDIVLKNNLLFRAYEQMHNPNHFLYRNCEPNKIEFHDAITINEVNLNIPYPTLGHSKISEGLFSMNNTVLQLEVRMLIPQRISSVMNTVTHKFRRIMAIVYDKKIAESILCQIYTYNMRLNNKDIPINSLINFFKPVDKEDNNYDSCISGFFIDNINDYLLCIEGPYNGYILTLWDQLRYLVPPKAKIFINSALFFLDRLYPQISEYIPFYIVSLKMPIQDLFQDKITFIRGNLPPHCFEAVKKLHILLNSHKLITICQQNLFPTSYELLSFAFEFGVPLKWRTSFSFEEIFERIM